MLKNTDGQKSASFTMMIVAFVIVSLWLVISIVAKIGSVEIRPFSGSEAMAYLTPMLALYWGRRAQLIQATKNTQGANSVPTEKLPE